MCNRLFNYFRRPGSLRATLGLRQTVAHRDGGLLKGATVIVSKSEIEIPLFRTGVYFLESKGVVVYVGVSEDVLSRFSGHKDKEYDRVVIHWCSSLDFAKAFEKESIAKLRPKLNVIYSPEVLERYAKNRERRNRNRLKRMTNSNSRYYRQLLERQQFTPC